MPDNTIDEVVVVVPEGTLNAAANPTEASTSTGSESVVEEIFDAILDPTGSNDPTDATAVGTGAGETEVVVVESAGVSPDAGGGTATSAVGAGEPEVVVIEPGADVPGTESGSATDPTSETDPGGVVEPTAISPDAGDGSTITPTGDTGAEGVAEPFAVSPDTEGISTPDTADPMDSPVTETGADDPSGVVGFDPDTTAADPDTTAADPDTTAAAAPLLLPLAA